MKPHNTVRFAWWGAEESGLVGSDFYVNNLTDGGARTTSPSTSTSTWSARRTTSGSSTTAAATFGLAGPAGSAAIEDLFDGLLRRPWPGLRADRVRRPVRLRAVHRTNGIPAGGLFTGAEGIKTPTQAAIYGGTAGAAVRPLLPPGVRHVRQQQRRGARPQRRRRRLRHADVRVLDGVRQRRAGQEGPLATSRFRLRPALRAPSTSKPRSAGPGGAAFAAAPLPLLLVVGRPRSGATRAANERAHWGWPAAPSHGRRRSASGSRDARTGRFPIASTDVRLTLASNSNCDSAAVVVRHDRRSSRAGLWSARAQTPARRAAEAFGSRSCGGTLIGERPRPTW